MVPEAKSQIPSKFPRINYFCQQLGAEEFLNHARVTEMLLPVSDSFHSSVGPWVPILKVVIQIPPRSRLDVKDAYIKEEKPAQREAQIKL